MPFNTFKSENYYKNITCKAQFENIFTLEDNFPANRYVS